MVVSSESSTATTQPILEFSHLRKVYGDCVANENISFQIGRGEIHGLIGENGAGKSTLMKMLFGLDLPTSGEIRLNGQVVQFASPLEAKAHRIGMVHQHFMQASQMTALEHMALEYTSKKSLRNFLQPIAWDRIRRRLDEISKTYRMEVPWDKKIQDLSIGYQQRIEILKLLDLGADILILDEPTAVLSPIEIERFLEQLKLLRSQGKTIILISHKLGEIKAVCDHVTVLRRGQVVWTGLANEKSQQQLAELMVGSHYEKAKFSPVTAEKPKMLIVKNLSVRKIGSTSKRDHLSQVNLRVHQHEIVGVAGVEGNGQSELIHVILNPSQMEIHQFSEIILDGQNIQFLDNQSIRELGVSLIAEDRLNEAVVPAMRVDENFLLGQQHRPDFVQGGLIRWSKVGAATQKALADLDVRPPDHLLTFASLSGGNQQKVVVGREISNQPKLLVAAHPTRGVDLHAIEKIHHELIKRRDEGSAILLISSDLDELFRLSDRIVVFCAGQIKAEFSRHEFDEKKIGAVMGGLGGET